LRIWLLEVILQQLVNVAQDVVHFGEESLVSRNQVLTMLTCSGRYQLLPLVKDLSAESLRINNAN
jgi:hypothetical protein